MDKMFFPGNPECANDGYCYDGNCYCSNGYGGRRCETRESTVCVIMPYILTCLCNVMCVCVCVCVCMRACVKCIGDCVFFIVSSVCTYSYCLFLSVFYCFVCVCFVVSVSR